MSLKTLCETKAARSIFYIIFVSGLLALISIIILLAWNLVISQIFTIKSIAFFEATGIASFFYVIYFGFRYGFGRSVDKKSHQTMPFCHSTDKMSDNTTSKNASSPTNQDKSHIGFFGKKARQLTIDMLDNISKN